MTGYHCIIHTHLMKNLLGPIKPSARAYGARSRSWVQARNQGVIRPPYNIVCPHWKNVLSIAHNYWT